MIRNLFFLVAFLSLSIQLDAQQQAQYSMFMMNRYGFNPAYAGFDGSLSATAVYRTQWDALEGRPVNIQINAHMPLYVFGGAIGFKLERETLGAFSNIRSAVSYNYVMDTDYGLFSGGISVGIHQSTLDGAILRARSGVYENNIIQHNDPVIPNTRVNGVAPTIGLGFYHINDYFELGLAVENVLNTKLRFTDDLEYINKRTFTAFFEYSLPVNDFLQVFPSLMLRSDLTQTQIEAAVKLEYDDNIIGGAGFRGYNANTIDALVLFGGLRLNPNLTLAYSYDIGLSSLNQIHVGTHEILLNYNLNKLIGGGIPQKVIYNPRFL
ncbi:MAG: PorP/SprF family type IX secretion system membrane protein [Bacteroidota bacterium]